MSDNYQFLKSNVSQSQSKYTPYTDKQYNYVNDINNPLERYDEYLLDIATGSIWTFYYSYDELYSSGHDLKKLELFLFNLIKTKFGKLIKTHFLDSIEECEEEKK